MRLEPEQWDALKREGIPDDRIRRISLIVDAWHLYVPKTRAGTLAIDLEMARILTRPEAWIVGRFPSRAHYTTQFTTRRRSLGLNASR